MARKQAESIRLSDVERSELEAIISKARTEDQSVAMLVNALFHGIQSWVPFMLANRLLK
ncbi:MAG TPA: hypothetical protein VLE70_01610 [Anaerolineae bacterium]|jgi:hypothetical protein|nr:hypothetical protein [Anaerolineae bacterium]